jgi:fermentation-respiration switch protein FrsA (DUF1100 family)
MARTLLFAFVAAALCLGVLKVLVLALEPKVAFYPIAGQQTTPAAFGLEFEERRVRTSDGELIHTWLLPHPSPRAHVVFWHGNGGNLSLWAEVIVDIQRLGATVSAPDYRGYGLSTGSPTETGLYRDTDAIVGDLPAHREPGVPLVYWGRSIGATVAAYAATVVKPDGLILEAAFPDRDAVLETAPVLRLLAVFGTYRFPTAELLKGYDGATLVIHGNEDEIAPYRHAERLFDGLRGEKRLVTIRGAHHNDLHLVDPATYRASIASFLDRVAARP